MSKTKYIDDSIAVIEVSIAENSDEGRSSAEKMINDLSQYLKNLFNEAPGYIENKSKKLAELHAKLHKI